MKYWGKYLKKKWKVISIIILLCAAYNAYFVFLMRDRQTAYLLYLDMLLGICLLFIAGIDFLQYAKKGKEKEAFLRSEGLVLENMPHFENRDIAEHESKILQAKLQERFAENCELQDYVAKWCHELKIPLAVTLLANKKIAAADVRMVMREQLERMNQQVNTLMLGCKLQSPLFDLQIKKVSLEECVKASIHNNQYFLIQKSFSMDVQVGGEMVYTDPSWLTYVLDQLIGNALKYAADNPKLSIWSKQCEDKVELYVEDHGEGILGSDLKRIYEKGFTGSNHHNGKYKSTGMGLYMVSQIMKRLGHEIHVESEYGSYTRFCIQFIQNKYYMR